MFNILNFFKNLFKKKTIKKNTRVNNTRVNYVKLKNGDVLWIVTRDNKTRYYKMKKSPNDTL
jgi:uncharacterized pyridoxamine 5'-phosphate oxidase family protein